MKQLLAVELLAPKGAVSDDMADYQEYVINAIFMALNRYATWPKSPERDSDFRIAIDELIQYGKDRAKEKFGKIRTDGLQLVISLWMDYDREVNTRDRWASIKPVEDHVKYYLTETEYTWLPVLAESVGSRYVFVDHDSENLNIGYRRANRCAPILSILVKQEGDDVPKAFVFVEEQQMACPSRYFHGSLRPIKKGTVFGVRNWDSEFGPYLEAVLEYYRPKNMTSRLNGVFLSDDPGNVNLAGGPIENVYWVKPLAAIHRHDFSWAEFIMSNLSMAGVRDWRSAKKVDEDKLARAIKMSEKAAKSYWEGTSSPRWAVWEYLTEKAEIMERVE
jgi:hypothetical protein